MRRNCIAVLIGSLVSLLCHAGTMGDGDYEVDDLAPGCNKVITLNGGPVWYNGGDSQVLALAPGIGYNYSNDSTGKVMGSGEVFFALAKPFYYNTIGQLGLAFAYSGNAEVGGQLNSFVVGSPVYDYQYQVKNYRIGLKGKLLGDYHYSVQPYLSAGIAAGFNDAYNFTVSPIIPGTVPPPVFTDHTNLAFSYTVGVGVEAALTPEWKVGFGYEFGDWGKSELGAVVFPINNLQPNNRGLQMDHFYTHELLLSLSYVY